MQVRALPPSGGWGRSWRAGRGRPRAREAKEQASKIDSGSRDQFLAGRLEAYYEVIATLLGQLDAFGIGREAVGLPKDYDPEKELL